jgi:chromosome partitioning protein
VFENLDLIPSDINLVGAEIELIHSISRETILKDHLHEIRALYDYVFLDCSPSLGLLTINSLTASDTVIIPVQCEYFALEGLGKLMNTIKIIQTRLNTNLNIEGILLTMFDTRLNLSNQVVSEISKHFKNLVFDTIIPRNIRLSESPSFGIPVKLHDPLSIGSKSYIHLAKEILTRNAIIV